MRSTDVEPGTTLQVAAEDPRMAEAKQAEAPEFERAADLQAKFAKMLEEEIIFGCLLSGERLVEDALMARFGMTCHVVHSALSSASVIRAQPCAR
jgi:hypothetical protein